MTDSKAVVCAWTSCTFTFVLAVQSSSLGDHHDHDIGDDNDDKPYYLLLVKLTENHLS